MMLIAALTVSSTFLLNGCSFGLPNSTDGQPLSVEAENENLTEGEIQVHSRWYNTDRQKLAGATIAFYDGKDLIFEGSTDGDGNLEVYTLPGNTELNCVITDASGNEIANAKVIYKISENYSSLTVYTLQEDSDTQKLEIPAGKTDLSMAIYITENGMISHANVTPYDETAAAEANESGEIQADQSQDGQADQSQDGQTDQPQDGQTDQPQDGQTDQPQDEQADQPQQ